MSESYSNVNSSVCFSETNFQLCLNSRLNYRVEPNVVTLWSLHLNVAVVQRRAMLKFSCDEM